MTTSLARRASRTCWHFFRLPTRTTFSPSSYGFISRQTPFHTSFVRRQSTQTKSLEDVTPSSTSSSSQMKENGVTAEPRLFSSLKGIISYDTWKAITVKPYKFTEMTAVQAAVFDYLPKLAQPYDPSGDRSVRPRDLLVKARTGTGKTAAFVVPAIEHRLNSIDAHCHQVVKDAGLTTDKHMEGRARRVYTREHAGSVIISPTRELAAQIAKEVQNLSYHHDDFEVRLFVGGSSRHIQMREWMRGRRDIVVATPGRLRDVLTTEPEVVKGLSKTPLVILDEADTLMDLGFREDIEAIMQYFPRTPERQTLMFSATVSRSIQQIASKVLANNYAFIDCAAGEESPVHDHVSQYHTVLPEAGEQIPHILRLLAHDQLMNPGRSKTVLFLPTTKQTQLFTTLLRELCRTTLPAGKGTRVYEMHSKRAQHSRTVTSDAFRNDKSGAAILITSDVSARGVDYPGVTRVIQIGIPQSTDIYIHRVGRTGRAGTSGRGDLVLLPWEMSFVTWQMNGISLKSVSVDEMKSQVEALASTFDEDPKAFFKNVKMSAGGPHSKSHHTRSVLLPTVFPSPYTPALKGMDDKIANLLPTLDEDAVRETVLAILGYYVGRAGELRIRKQAIVDGCKQWATQALGLPTPPYISENFLQKLGLSQDRVQSPRSQGGYSSGSRPRSSSQAPWIGRGRQGSRSERRDDDFGYKRNSFGRRGDQPGKHPKSYDPGRGRGRGREDF